MKKILLAVYMGVIYPLLLAHVKSSSTTIDDKILEWITELFEGKERIKLLKTIYAENIRPELAKYVEETETDIDDKLLAALDKLFKHDDDDDK